MRNPWPWALIAVLAVVGCLAFWRMTHAPEPPPAAPLSVPPPAVEDGPFAAGKSVHDTLAISHTWVFADEPVYGSFVLGRAGPRFVWLKLPLRYRWLTATRLRTAHLLEFRGTVKGPRGDGVQVDEGEILAVDGQPLAAAEGLDWPSVEDALFSSELTDAIRAERWRHVSGKRLDEVGRVAQLSADGRTLTVKFRDRTITWDAEVVLATPVTGAAVEAFTKGTYVLVSGRLHDYAVVNGAVTLDEGTAEAITPRTGLWAGLR